MKSCYEQLFYLKYHGGWSFIEAYNLPVGLRNFFSDMLTEQLEKEAEAYSGSGKGTTLTEETAHLAQI